MSYWHIPEDTIYGILGIEPMMNVSDIIPMLPEGYGENESAALAFHEAVENKVGELDSAVERVLDDVRAKAEEGLDDYLVYKGVDPDDYSHLLWYKNMLDDFAQETLFGLRGGEPEYNEVTLNYLPAMFEELGQAEDENFFNVMVSECDRVGQESWDDWVVPTVQEAYTSAKAVLSDTPIGWDEAQWKEAMDNGVVIVYDDVDDSFNIYHDGHLIEQAIRQPEEVDAFAKAIASKQGLNPDRDIFYYNYEDDDTATVYDTGEEGGYGEDYSKHMSWTPSPKPDPRQTRMPFAAAAKSYRGISLARSEGSVKRLPEWVREASMNRSAYHSEEELLAAIERSEGRIRWLQQKDDYKAADEEQLVLDDLLAQYGDDEYLENNYL